MKKIAYLVIACLAAGIFLGAPRVLCQDDVISLNFENVSLGTVLNILSRKTGKKFITDAGLARKKIVFNLKRVTPDEALNALLDTYNLYYIRQTDTDIYVIKDKTSKMITAVSKIIYCNYATASKLVGVLGSNLSQGGKISADERTNSLIITDMADNIEKIEGLLKKLDTPTPQVLLEARILDVKIDKSLKTGVNIANFFKTDEYWTDPLAQERANRIEDEEIEGDDIHPNYNYRQPFSHSAGGEGTFKIAIIKEGYNIEALIEAVKTDRHAKILNTPKILVLNNEEATIDIIDQIPYEERTQTEEGGQLVSTAFKDVGVRIKVKPQINKNGTVILSVSPEQSFQTGQAIGNIPIINTSKLDTTFMLRDGETAVIGGLIRVTDSDTEDKIPILGDIPILGYLFKKTDKQEKRSELTIFVTAHVMTEKGGETVE
jgi:type IV pilus assembly protein PilQ